MQFIILHKKTAAYNFSMILSCRTFSPVSILRIEIMYADFYLQDRTHSNLRKEIL